MVRAETACCLSRNVERDKPPALNTRQNIGAINRPSATSPTHCCCGVNRKRDKSLGLWKSGKPSEDSHHVLCGTLYVHCPPSAPMRRLFDGHRTLTAPCEPHIPVSTRRPRRSGKNTCVFSQPQHYVRYRTPGAITTTPPEKPVTLMLGCGRSTITIATTSIVATQTTALEQVRCALWTRYRAPKTKNSFFSLSYVHR